MTDRERLIELIDNFIHTVNVIEWYSEEIDEQLADHLLANGVIVPPCKVGDTVWFIRNKTEIIATVVEKVILKHGGLYIKLGCNSMYETSSNSIGKTVFLTKEEAEAKLKEREGK